MGLRMNKGLDDNVSNKLLFANKSVFSYKLAVSNENYLLIPPEKEFL